MVSTGNEQAKATHYGKRRPGYGTEYGAVPTAEEIVNSLDNKGIGDLQFSVEELESILDERDLTNLRVLAESIVKAMIDIGNYSTIRSATLLLGGTLRP